MEAFMALLTPELRNDIQIGRVPQKPEADKPAASTNGIGNAELHALAEASGAMGVPLPEEAGFDLSEEPS
jgi:hypothetical protein